MKTKTNILRLLSGLLFIAFIQINASSENHDSPSSEVMYYSFIYDYPINSYSDIELADWMICPCAFENNEFYQYLTLDWLDKDNGSFCFALQEFEENYNQWFLGNDDGYYASTEVPVMRWMLGFEPIVLNELLKDVKPELLESWMYSVNSFIQLDESVPEVVDWMLAEDLGIEKPQLEFDFWMIVNFGVN